MSYNIKYQKNFNNINDVMKQHVEETIEKNVERKMESFWKKYLKHPDAEALIKIDIEETKDGRYKGGVNINVPGGPQIPYKHERYNKIIDLINHGFSKYPEALGKVA